ncbi:MAG: hypothetical protein H6Q68_2576 [Firmicutes bacterium]|nr:hypothetical protein [Bacillota bacterium]
MDLNVYSRRWGQRDGYEITKTRKGWHVKFGAEGGVDSDKTGYPQLFRCLDHDGVNYPEGLGEYMEFLWEESEGRSLNNNEIQAQLNLLSDWIEVTEKSSPKGIWQDFK